MIFFQWFTNLYLRQHFVGNTCYSLAQQVIIKGKNEKISYLQVVILAIQHAALWASTTLSFNNLSLLH